jgi:hypothetical protein
VIGVCCTDKTTYSDLEQYMSLFSRTFSRWGSCCSLNWHAPTLCLVCWVKSDTANIKNDIEKKYKLLLLCVQYDGLCSVKNTMVKVNDCRILHVQTFIKYISTKWKKKKGAVSKENKSIILELLALFQNSEILYMWNFNLLFIFNFRQR